MPDRDGNQKLGAFFECMGEAPMPRLNHFATSLYINRNWDLVLFFPPDHILEIDARADVVGNNGHALADFWHPGAILHIYLAVFFGELEDFGLGILDDVAVAGVGSGAAAVGG